MCIRDRADIARKHNVTPTAVRNMVKKHGSLAAADKALTDSPRIETGAKGTKEDLHRERIRLTRAQADTAEINLAERKAQLVEASRVVKALTENVARARAMLDSAFRSELPAKQGGMPADQIAAMNGERLDEIYEQLSKPL